MREKLGRMRLKDKMLWIPYSNLIETELTECRQEGRIVDPSLEEEALALVKEKDNLSDKDRPSLETRAKDILLRLEASPLQDADSEPDQFDDIIRDADRSLVSVDHAALRERISGAWYGRIIGCTLGIPVEGWYRDEILDYLEKTGQADLSDYIHATADPDIREEYQIRETDPMTSYDRQHYGWRDYLAEFPVDDDINYTVSGLKTLERYGRDFGSDDIGETWVFGIPPFHTCTAERAAVRNMLLGMTPPETARYANPYREWIGAQIRADIWGYVNPGDPLSAASMAYRDAVVSHTGNGVYGEIYIAVLISLTLAEAGSIKENIRRAMTCIPSTSRLYRALDEVVSLFEDPSYTFDDFEKEIHRRYDERSPFDWCSVISNAMIVTAILLTTSDFSEAIGRAVKIGFDTDCNAATVGSVLGASLGKKCIPDHWYTQFPDVINTSICGYSRMSFEDAIGRTMQQVERR